MSQLEEGAQCTPSDLSSFQWSNCVHIFREFISLNTIHACYSTTLCSDVYPNLDCRPTHKKTVEDPPLLFNLDQDPSEVYTLTPEDPEYNDIMDTMKTVSSMLSRYIYLGISRYVYILHLNLFYIVPMATFHELSGLFVFL